jgi:hypothetical protein
MHIVINDLPIKARADRTEAGGKFAPFLVAITAAVSWL